MPAALRRQGCNQSQIACALGRHRSTVGRWEADTVVASGAKDCVVTPVERKNGLVLIGKLRDRTAGSPSRRPTRLIRSVGRVETVTADNEAAFHDYERVERLTGVSTAGLTQHRCSAIARRLNARPRKRFGFRTPLEYRRADGHHALALDGRGLFVGRLRDLKKLMRYVLTLSHLSQWRGSSPCVTDITRHPTRL